MTHLTDFDLHLFGQGTYRRAYEKLGAHLQVESGQPGVRFALWAPSAHRISLVGDFNAWQPGVTPMQATGSSGIWQTFVPHLEEGALYKFAIQPSAGSGWLQKADPFAFRAELRPRTASIVSDTVHFRWTDSDWVSGRQNVDAQSEPIAIYELHPGSWRRDPSDPDRFLTYGELAEQLPAYLLEMGFTHVEMMPVAEHPLDRSWGYQITGYFAPSARFGTPAEFAHLVDCCHRAGIGVLLDWVPAHFPKDSWALAEFDGTKLFEHADQRRGEHPDWGTLIFNYSRHEVRGFLIANALFWLDRYHIDGLRVDAVASMLYLDYSREAGEWIPNEFGGRENLEAIDFLRELNSTVHDQFSSALMIAEESTAWPGVTAPTQAGGLGFDFKWNMGWMHDTLAYLKRDPVHRGYHHDELTFSLVYAFSERFVLPLSHDEVVHGKGSLWEKAPGDLWQKFANLRLLISYQYTHPGKKLLFMGAEFGQENEWNFEHSLDWHLIDGPSGSLHRGVQALVSELNRLYRRESALHRDDRATGFRWIDHEDSGNSVISFERIDPTSQESLLVICNFTPVVRERYRIGVPRDGRYSEVFNSDRLVFGGSAVSVGPALAEDVHWHGRPWSMELTLPPLAAVILQRDAGRG